MSVNEDGSITTPLDWIRYAEGDLRVAEREIETANPSYHTICFLCQGAAEKFLKAYLISRGWQLEKTHDILKLLKYCVAYQPEFTQLMLPGEILNEYIIGGRYPASLTSEKIDHAEAVEAIESTRAIRMQVMALL